MVVVMVRVVRVWRVVRVGTGKGDNIIISTVLQVTQRAL